MIYMTLGEAAFELKVEYDGADIAFEGISTDTRTLQPGNLFFALVGPNFDGHDFLATAAEKGCVAAVVSKPVSINFPQLLVRDTQAALGSLALAWRERFDLTVIGVTGSNGKTTTKMLIHKILLAANEHHADRVLATAGTLNNQIGVPLTLFQISKHHRFAVLEMGMNQLGEIDYLTRLCEPDVAVITNAKPSHLEGLGTLENIAKAKGEIFEGLHHQGLGVINNDDSFADYWVKLVKPRDTLTFGFKEGSQVTAHIQQETLSGTTFVLATPKGKIEITLQLAGKHNVANALAAAAATLHLENVTLDDIKQGLESGVPVDKRLVIRNGRNQCRIIDDCYNANPSSVQAAIEVFQRYPNQRVLVLGDMGELGPTSEELHRQVGELAKNSGIEKLYTFGKKSQAISAAFGDSAQHFADAELLIQALIQECRPDTAILIKGSRSMKMESIVKALLQ